MSNLVNKKQVAYTINKEIIKHFNELSLLLGSNKSKVIEILIKKWIEENEKSKEKRNGKTL